MRVLRAVTDHGLGPAPVVGTVASGLATLSEFLVAENLRMGGNTFKFEREMDEN